MQTAKIFMNGRSQAVRLPKAFQFDGSEVIIRHFGNGVLLLPKSSDWQNLFEAVQEFEPGFELERAPQEEQIREDFL